MDRGAFKRITAELDWLLQAEGDDPGVMATPFLHPIDPHPEYLGRYEHAYGGEDGGTFRTLSGVARSFGSLCVKNLRASLRGAAKGTSQERAYREQLDLIDASGVDALMVSWCVSPSHLPLEDDFYFGSLQKHLRDKGARALLLLMNLTGQPNGRLAREAFRAGETPRIMLPMTYAPWRECCYLAAAVRASMRMFRHRAPDLRGRLAAQATRECCSHQVILTLKLRSELMGLADRFDPSHVFALYEGYAWERVVWHILGIRFPSVVRVGYQHAPLRENVHAPMRTPGRGGHAAPEAVLTSGEPAHALLKRASGTKGLNLYQYGSHRTAAPGGNGAGGVRPKSVLVLPEGMEGEVAKFWAFATKCARAMPEARFILRLHPLVKASFVDRLDNGSPRPANVSVSDKKDIEEDFKRSGYVMYRGTSAVVPAVRHGLKPMYVEFRDEIRFDPLFHLQGWREIVKSVDDVRGVLAGTPDRCGEEWLEADSVCGRYYVPMNTGVLDELLSLAPGRRAGERGGGV